jgi:ribonuclease R
MSAKRGQWRLIVAIADVSHYVRTGDALDVDAQARSTSVYFPRRVIPMLPEKLSNGLCSLNPRVDRLVLAADMVIDAEGEITAYQFYPAVMCSRARLTYTEVAEALTVPGSGAARRLEPLLAHLNALYELYRALARARARRGAIDLETVETYIECDADGRIERIVPRVRNDAHRLIEECMLAANVCAADFLTRAKRPALYRVHEGPTAERLGNLRALLKTLGLALDGADAPRPADYAVLAKKIQARPDAQLLQTALLRSMRQAVYTPHNLGHFGLAYPRYAHFTSPIRRYPDLLTHRALKAILARETFTPRLLVAGAVDAVGAVGKSKKVSAAAVWDRLGMLCSANERRADEASRDVEAWLKSWYMRERIGETYSGTVSAVVPFGVFVLLDELYVEGLVHVSELGSEYFSYNEALHELRGERTGLRFRLGDRLSAQVARVDLEARRIDFRLVDGSQGRHSPSGEMAPAGAGKPARNTARAARTPRGVDERAPRGVEKRKADERKTDPRERARGGKRGR